MSDNNISTRYVDIYGGILHLTDIEVDYTLSVFYQGYIFNDKSKFYYVLLIKVFLLYKQSKIPYFIYHLFSTVYSALFDFFFNCRRDDYSMTLFFWFWPKNYINVPFFLWAFLTYIFSWRTLNSMITQEWKSQFWTGWIDHLFICSVLISYNWSVRVWGLLIHFELKNFRKRCKCVFMNRIALSYVKWMCNVHGPRFIRDHTLTENRLLEHIQNFCLNWSGRIINSIAAKSTKIQHYWYSFSWIFS